MQSIFAAFPRRALTLKVGRGAAGAWFLAVMSTVLFGGFLALTGAQVLPAIRDDLAIRDAARPAPQVRVSGGQCRSRLALFQDCEVTLSWRGKDGTGSRKIHYMFVEPHMGSWTVIPMMDPSRPELVSTDLGVERLTNRIATAIGAVIFALALIGGGILAGMKAQRKSGAVKALSGRVLQPTAATMLASSDALNWHVRDADGGVHEWPVKKKDRPFMLDDERGLVLALRDPSGGPAFPLDAALRLVDLTAEERQRILAVRAVPG